MIHKAYLAFENGQTAWHVQSTYKFGKVCKKCKVPSSKVIWYATKIEINGINISIDNEGVWVRYISNEDYIDIDKLFHTREKARKAIKILNNKKVLIIESGYPFHFFTKFGIGDKVWRLQEDYKTITCKDCGEKISKKCFVALKAEVEEIFFTVVNETPPVKSILYYTDRGYLGEHEIYSSRNKAVKAAKELEKNKINF